PQLCFLIPVDDRVGRATEIGQLALPEGAFCGRRDNEKQGETKNPHSGLRNDARPFGLPPQPLVPPSERTAWRTSSAWPGTFTLRHSRRRTPSASIRNVLRSMPMTFLPYMFFSLMTSNM